MKSSEDRFRVMVDTIPALVWCTLPDGSNEFHNQRWHDYTGLPEGAETGWGWKVAYHPEDLERLLNEFQSIVASGAQRARRKDGQYRWFLIRFNPFHDDTGHPARWYGTGTDVEDRKRAEERTRNENVALREEIDRSSMFEEIVGTSSALRQVLAQVAKVAPTDSTVLISGETGTGKELIARAVHKRSNRSARAFIRVNCGAISPSLIASELFGHEKGAFTGALQRRIGRFEAADGGTIFLDEIGDLSMEVQIALLRVLQEREFERVGSSQPLAVDVRVLAATNCDLKSAVDAGTFRQDLFYRLNVFPIHLPSLRERVDDIPLLIEYFVDRYAQKAGKKFSDITSKTLALFQGYHWPGNIRELQNVIERAVILCDGETFSVDATWLKQESSPVSGPSVPLVSTLVERERQIIEAALSESQGRVSGANGAAKKLGIPRQTLDARIESLSIDKQRFKTR
jgi:formate hydrogenlyase transcriptional activator